MTYLTFSEYTDLGGKLDETAFNRNIERASAMIDIRTYSRLEKFEEIPKIVKVVCSDLIDYVSMNTVEKAVASKSQSAGGVSESITFKTANDYLADLDGILEPLGVIKTTNGISITYRGAML